MMTLGQIARMGKELTKFTSITIMMFLHTNNVDPREPPIEMNT